MRADVLDALARHGASLDESGFDPRIDVPLENWAALHADLAALGLEFSDITALDRIETVELVCWLLISPREQLSVRTSCPGEWLVAPSISAVYPPAEWGEREVFDMFGVAFRGHPDMTRILQPDDATIFPLRKSFELTETPW
jgi:NADH:ubiquinone oxidoreductase subunit C